MRELGRIDSNKILKAREMLAEARKLGNRVKDELKKLAPEGLKLWCIDRVSESSPEHKDNIFESPMLFLKDDNLNRNIVVEDINKHLVVNRDGVVYLMTEEEFYRIEEEGRMIRKLELKVGDRVRIRATGYARILNMVGEVGTIVAVPTAEMWCYDVMLDRDKDTDYYPLDLSLEEIEKEE